MSSPMFLTEKEYKEFIKNKKDSQIVGTKLDCHKPDLDLVLGDFSRALIAVGKVGTFGAKKYAEHDWLFVPNGARRYKSALLRHHFLTEIEGEYDSDSNLLHAAHEAWNALAILELRLRELEVSEIKEGT